LLFRQWKARSTTLLPYFAEVAETVGGLTVLVGFVTQPAAQSTQLLRLLAGLSGGRDQRFAIQIHCIWKTFEVQIF